MIIDIVRGDDWSGIYFDGELEWEHHDIEEYGWSRLHNKHLSVPWTEICLNQEGIEWLSEEGGLPKLLSNIPEWAIA